MDHQNILFTERWDKLSMRISKYPGVQIQNTQNLCLIMQKKVPDYVNEAAKIAAVVSTCYDE